MTTWTYYQWLGGPTFNEHLATLRRGSGSLVEAFDAATNSWTKIPSSVLLDRLEEGSLDVERISEARALELTGTTREHHLVH